MLSIQIKAKQSIISTALAVVANAFKPQQMHPQPNNRNIMAPVWDKAKFTQYIEEVKKTFSVGMLVTLAAEPVVENRLPNVYHITGINELWYDSYLDMALQQPRCLHVIARNLKDNTSYGWCCCPLRVRPLTKSELDLVELQNQPVQGVS